MRRIRRITLAGGVAAAALAIVPASSSADSMFAVTASNNLISFDSRQPQGISTPVQITGLQPNESILAIDARPSTGQLFALGSSSRIYIVNPISGVAQAIGSTAFTPALNSTTAGFGFNPTNDRIRIVSAGDQNLAVNPNNQAVTVDPNVAYAAGDPGAGTNPQIMGVSYTNSFLSLTPPASTQLYDIDAARNTLVRQNPPASGQLTTIGALGIDVTGRGGFDIGTGNTAYGAFTLQGQTQATLYQINLSTGQATPVTGNAQTSQIGTSAQIVAMASNGPSGQNTNDPTVVVANPNVKRISLVISQGIGYTVACNEACTVNAVLRRGNTQLGTASSFVQQPGRVALQINLTSAGRAAMQNVTGGTLSLVTTASDFFGNQSTVTRTITLVQ